VLPPVVGLTPDSDRFQWLTPRSRVLRFATTPSSPKRSESGLLAYRLPDDWWRTKEPTHVSQANIQFSDVRKWKKTVNRFRAF